MNECYRCYGTGIEEYEEEDYRMVRDTCYHCSGSGKVDDEMHFQDKLSDVAHSLAADHVYQMRKWVNSDPDGEGWSFRAAENMMSDYEYTQGMIYNKVPEYLDGLLDMDRSTQELMIAWNEYRV